VKVKGSAQVRTSGLLAMSGAAHIVVFSVLGLVPPPAEVLAMHEMAFEVVEPEPPPPPPKIEEPPPPEPDPEPRARAAPKAEPQEPPPAEAPPAAEEVADFTGVTLTGGDGASWSTAIGSGAPLKGPVGKIGTQQGEPQQAAKVAAPGPRVVALDSLARKPSAPPNLGTLLEQFFPRRARMQGVEGRAVARLRILPNGRITNVRVVEEYPAGYEFGAACREMLQAAPPWVPPLDKSGVPVAADVPFTCTFVVNY
jgi:TonB family protein